MIEDSVALEEQIGDVQRKVDSLAKPETFINKLMAFDSDTLESILKDLMDGSKNVTLKTEFNNPTVMAQARVFVMMLRNGGLVTAADFLKEFLDEYEKAMVSFKRKRSAEIVQAISSMGLASQERSAKDKLFGGRGEVK
jgi:hypothetical protein